MSCGSPAEDSLSVERAIMVCEHLHIQEDLPCLWDFVRRSEVSTETKDSVTQSIVKVFVSFFDRKPWWGFAASVLEGMTAA